MILTDVLYHTVDFFACAYQGTRYFNNVMLPLSYWSAELPTFVWFEQSLPVAEEHSHLWLSDAT